MPFFKTLKKCTKKSNFQWTQEAEVAFRQMKKLIAKLPMLTAPKEMEELIIYLETVAQELQCSLNDRERAERKQMLSDFKSRALQAEATNNEAKYEALIADLRIAKQMGVKNLQANVDSRLVARLHLQALHILKILPEDKKKARAVRRKASSPSPHSKKSTTELNPITSPWANSTSGRSDIAGLFSEAVKKVKFLIVPLTTSQMSEAQACRGLSGAISERNSYGTTSSTDSAYQGRLYQIMENGFVTTHSKTGV
ncbi:hypothetical protein Tco_0744575 [Tanacetum coccineum]